MTITELHIQFDLYPENKINILEDIATAYCSNGYIFVDLLDGHCYLFDRNGNEDDVKKLKTVDTNVFYSSNIESIVIPDSVAKIGDWAFAYCENLKSIEIPDSVKRIGYRAFIYCESLKSIIISDSVESVGDSAFWGCESLTSLIFKGKTIDQVKNMENYPFGIKNKSIIRCI